MTGDSRLSRPPEMRRGLGIRRPPADVFEAFVDPAITKRFWIAGSSGRLETGAKVVWDLTADGLARADVVVQTAEPGEGLGFDWGDAAMMTTVQITFAPWGDGGCYVEVTETGFTGAADAMAAYAVDSMGGFTMALCSLKALLEHGVELRAVEDRLP